MNPPSDLPDPKVSVEEIAAFFQEALDETEGMELPHAYHMLRVKVLSRISALSSSTTGRDERETLGRYRCSRCDALCVHGRAISDESFDRIEAVSTGRSEDG